MQSITTRKQDALAADPSALLAQTMALERFAGVPTLVLDGGTLPDDAAALATHIGGLIESRRPAAIENSFWRSAADEACERLQHAFNITHTHIAEKIAADRREGGHVVPHALRIGPVDVSPFADRSGPACYRPLRAAIVFAPGADFQPRDLLRYAGIAAAPGDDNRDYTAWRYWITHHELAHVAGADEPQADLIASLFTRRAFPSDPALQIMADMRAVVNSRDAVLLHENPGNQDLHDNLATYGWPMVEAIDTVLAMDQAAIDALSDSQIIARRFNTPDRDPARLIKLGGIFAKASGELDCRVTDEHGNSRVEKKRCRLFAQGHLDLIEQAADFMAGRAADYTDDPVIHAMAARTARAAQRLGALFTPAMPA
jgi:hypothetical protein